MVIHGGFILENYEDDGESFTEITEIICNRSFDWNPETKEATR